MYLHFIICAFYCTCMHNIIFKKEGSSHFNFTCIHMHVNELKLNYFYFWKKLYDFSIYSKNKLLNDWKNFVCWKLWEVSATRILSNNKQWFHDLLVRLVNAQKAKAADRVEANVFKPIIDFNIAAGENFGNVFIHSNDFLSIQSNGLPTSSHGLVSFYYGSFPIL